MTRSSLTAAALMLALSSSPAPAHASARPPQQAPDAAEPSLEAVAAGIQETLRQRLFDPAVLSRPEFQDIERQTLEAAHTSESTEAFRRAFNALWRNGPISHVVLRNAQAPADQTAAYLDQLRVGEGARLEWNDDVAILTVNTMMGADTIEQIDAAYADIVRKDARAVIIDQRSNEGGAFAIVPLVQHLIDSPMDAGAFVSQAWAAESSRAPTLEDVADISPWRGWSIRDFWRVAREDRITRIAFEPQAPRFAGPVYVLTSATTASAAEMAADALKATGHATLIGEPTAGEMLSQMPFDLPRGLQLFLPIADYYSFRSGRIEGRGVQPDVSVPADRAMDEALALARR